MYSPTMWAYPNNLELIKEKKEIEYSEDAQMKIIEKKQIEPKKNFFEILYKPLAFLRLFKISSRSYSYK